MRPRVLVIFLAALAAAGCGSKKQAETTARAAPRLTATAHFRVTVSAPTHTPRVGPKWWYVVSARDTRGRAVAGRLTAQVIDPLGTAHPVEVGVSRRKLVDYPFSGLYRDFAQWPASSRGYRLVFRVTVVANGGARRSASYWVRPR